VRVLIASSSIHFRTMGSTKKHKIREPKKRKHRSRSKSRSPERNKHRHHKKHHKDRKKEKLIKDKNGECVQKYNSYDSEGKLQLFRNSFLHVCVIAHQVCGSFFFFFFLSRVFFV
jgi:hypothetical protein